MELRKACNHPCLLEGVEHREQDRIFKELLEAGKLEGIGARLQKRDDYTRVAELISGGPAWRGGELEVGDLIIKVALDYLFDEESLDWVNAFFTRQPPPLYQRIFIWLGERHMLELGR